MNKTLTISSSLLLSLVLGAIVPIGSTVYWVSNLATRVQHTEEAVSNFKETDTKLINNIKDNIPKLIDLINKQNLNEYIKTVVNFSFEANKYFNDSEPWLFKKKNPERMNTILNTIVEQIKNISILLNPIIPISTKKVLNTINISDKDILIETIKKENVIDNNKELKNLDILFRKIENDN